MSTKVSVILPTRNEEKLIKQLLLEISNFISKKGYKYEIVVVANGCDDDTVNIVNNLSKKNKSIKLITSKPGYGYALRKGMKYAKGDYIIIFNVDFYDLKIIDLVDIDLYGRDLIIGSKMAQWSEDRRPLKRRIVSTLYNFFLSLAFGFKGSDTHGIKVMNKNVVNKILNKCKTKDGIMDTEFVIKCQRAGFKIADFPVILEEKRTSRFVNRFLSTPIDIYKLSKALK